MSLLQTWLFLVYRSNSSCKKSVRKKTASDSSVFSSNWGKISVSSIFTSIWRINFQFVFFVLLLHFFSNSVSRKKMSEFFFSTDASGEVVSAHQSSQRPGSLWSKLRHWLSLYFYILCGIPNSCQVSSACSATCKSFFVKLNFSLALYFTIFLHTSSTKEEIDK